MNIVEPFSTDHAQKKFMLMAIDYFTKWIEAKALATIIAQQVQTVVWKNIICRFGLSHTVITDNSH